MQGQQLRFKQIAIERIKTFCHTKMSAEKEIGKVEDLKDKIRDKEKDLLEMNKKVDNLRHILNSQQNRQKIDYKMKNVNNLLTKGNNVGFGASSTKKKKITQEDKELNMLNDQVCFFPYKKIEDPGYRYGE